MYMHMYTAHKDIYEYVYIYIYTTTCIYIYIYKSTRTMYVLPNISQQDAQKQVQVHVPAQYTLRAVQACAVAVQGSQSGV